MTGYYRTNVQGLNDLIQPGIPVGSSTLIYGSPGTMKTSLAYHILNENCKENEELRKKTHYFLIGQNLDSFKYHLSKLGLIDNPTADTVIEVEQINLPPFIEKTRKIEEHPEFGEYDKKEVWIDIVNKPLSIINNFIETLLLTVYEEKLKLIVIDTISNIYPLIDKKIIHYLLGDFLNQLNHLGKINNSPVTTILISEDVESTKILEYLVDNIINLKIDVDRFPSEVLLSVKKMRGKAISRHENILHYEPSRRFFIQSL